MWIRSQDKTNLISCRRITLIGPDKGVCLIVELTTDNYIELAEYKSKERAIEVLDEVEKKINLINLGHDFGSPMIDLKNPTYIYQMPNE